MGVGWGNNYIRGTEKGSREKGEMEERGEKARVE